MRRGGRCHFERSEKSLTSKGLSGLNLEDFSSFLVEMTAGLALEKSVSFILFLV